MGFTVTVLGSSGTYAGAGNACTGFLLRTDTTTVMVDAGPGTFANLQTHIDPDELDGIFISHSHPDHWLDLPVMRNAFKYVLGIDELPLFTTKQTIELAETLASGGVGSTLSAQPVTDGSTFSVGDLSFRCSRTDHPVETLAIRVDHDGRSFAYTSDTGPRWSLSALGPSIDLALSEATFLDGQSEGEPVHLSAREAGERARDAGVGRLVLTHILPANPVAVAVEQASDAYGAPVDVAEVHSTFHV